MVPKLLSILSKIPLCMSIYITCIIVVSKMLLLLLWFTYFLCDPFLFKGINNYERKRLNRGAKHGRCLVRGRSCLPFANIWVHARFYGGVRVAHLFSFLCCCFFALSVFILCLVHPMLPVSLDSPFLIVPSVSLTFVKDIMKYQTNRHKTKESNYYTVVEWLIS